MSRAVTHEQISQILMHVWDPILIADEPACANEYDAYVDRVWHVCMSGSIDGLVSLLIGIETHEMGLPGDRARAYRTAQAIVELR